MLTARFYPVQGGAEIQCLRLSRELQKSNIDVFVLTQALPSQKRYEVMQGIPVFRVGMPFAHKIGSLTYIFSGFLWLIRNLRKFDILHVHLASSPAILAGIIALITRKPVVLKFGGSRKTGDIATSSATWYGRLKLAFLRVTADLFVCPSKEIAEELLNAGFPEAKIRIIPNGIDIELFKPVSEEENRRLRKNLRLPQESRVLVYIGRFEPGKGIDVLLDAWSHIHNSIAVRSFLLMVGTGSLDSQIREKCHDMDSVIFIGWKDDTEKYLQASDIFVLPSFGEGLPNSLIEAMSCGLPCLATNIGGINELIQNGMSGILIPPGDKDRLLHEMNNLICSHDRRAQLGGAARIFIENNLSMSVIGSKYCALYRDLLRGKGTYI